MTPVLCRIKHDPEAGTYGDCVRACVAAMMDLQAEDVPHFYHDGCDGEEGHRRVSAFLAGIGYAPFYSNFDARATIEEVFAFMEVMNPGPHYMLLGRTAGGEDHAIVCKGGEMVHDPAWMRQRVCQPASAGLWQVMVVARL